MKNIRALSAFHKVEVENTTATKPLEAYEAQLLMAAGDLSRVRAAPMWRRVGVLK